MPPYLIKFTKENIYINYILIIRLCQNYTVFKTKNTEEPN